MFSFDQKQCVAVILFFGFSAFFHPFCPSFADENCAQSSHEQIVRSQNATASLWANWLHSDESISKVSEEMFQEAYALLPNLQLFKELCTSPCKAASHPLILFESLPNKFLIDYDEKSKCEGLLSTTIRYPIQYKKDFSDLNDLINWTGLLSRGKGKEGENLYAKCSGSCSPQYFYTINIEESHFQAQVNIICGHARDKEDDSYNLRYGFRWQCHNS